MRILQGLPFLSRSFCYHVPVIELFGTLGPACRDQNTLIKMFQEGMTGMRLNLSHSGLKESEAMIRAYQEAAEKAGVQAELLIDLQGPELRIGRLKEPLVLEDGTAISPELLPFPSAVLDALEEADHILLDDGKLELAVEAGSFRVLRGGRLESRKSIKIVNKDIPMPALTDADRANLALAMSYGVSAVMQPFVRNARDLKEVREELHRNHADSIRIFSKIENRIGLANLDEIISHSDMVVIARGDLGNDIPLPQLPGVQKDIAAACIRQNVPFLVVTQMLTSMIKNPVPTRAEVSDIFNAVTDGASAVMVTNETAAGDHPVEVIRILHETTAAAEQWIRKKDSERF